MRIRNTLLFQASPLILASDVLATNAATPTPIVQLISAPTGPPSTAPRTAAPATVPTVPVTLDVTDSFFSR